MPFDGRPPTGKRSWDRSRRQHGGLRRVIVGLLGAAIEMMQGIRCLGDPLMTVSAASTALNCCETAEEGFAKDTVHSVAAEPS